MPSRAHQLVFRNVFVQPNISDYRSAHPQYNYLFNSYYNAVGPFHCRPKRGLLSRPTVREVYSYRQYVDELMLELLGRADERKLDDLRPRITLGLNHEQQHQELMLTDITTEYSHKYSLVEFSELAQRAGFEVLNTWMGANKLFSVQYLGVRLASNSDQRKGEIYGS